MWATSNNYMFVKHQTTKKQSKHIKNYETLEHAFNKHINIYKQPETRTDKKHEWHNAEQANNNN